MLLMIPISNELCVLPNIGQSLSRGLQHYRKTNHEEHQEHEEMKNLRVLGVLRSSKIRCSQGAVPSPPSPTLRLQKAHSLIGIRMTIISLTANISLALDFQQASRLPAANFLYTGKSFLKSYRFTRVPGQLSLLHILVFTG
jgi:hypothetical protein